MNITVEDINILMERVKALNTKVDNLGAIYDCPNCKQIFINTISKIVEDKKNDVGYICESCDEKFIVKT